MRDRRLAVVVPALMALGCDPGVVGGVDDDLETNRGTFASTKNRPIGFKAYCVSVTEVSGTGEMSTRDHCTPCLPSLPDILHPSARMA